MMPASPPPHPAGRSSAATTHDATTIPRAADRRPRTSSWSSFRYRDLLHQLVARNIKVRYKRSALGVVWSMLSPLLTTVVLSVVFLTVFQPVTPNYPVYLLCGLLIWNFFVQATSTMAAEMIGGAYLWKRIYTPRRDFRGRDARHRAGASPAGAGAARRGRPVLRACRSGPHG